MKDNGQSITEIWNFGVFTGDPCLNTPEIALLPNPNTNPGILHQFQLYSNIQITHKIKLHHGYLQYSHQPQHHPKFYIPYADGFALQYASTRE